MKQQEIVTFSHENICTMIRSYLKQYTNLLSNTKVKAIYMLPNGEFSCVLEWEEGEN